MEGSRPCFEPVKACAGLCKVVANRDTSVEALLKLYVGLGLRQDLSKLFAERVMEKTAQVLSRHLQSEEEVSAILKDIRVETAQQLPIPFRQAGRASLFLLL